MPTTPNQGIPIEKLQALLDASDEMVRSVFRRDRKATLDTMARHVRKLLNVESCAIFLVANDFGDELVLESSSTDLYGDEFAQCPPLKVRSVPRGGLTGHIARVGKIVRLTRRQLKRNRYIAHPGKAQSHLASGVCYSVMGIPLREQGGRLLGLVKPENKKGLDGKPGENVVFDKVDEQLARILANKAVTIIECMRIEEEYRRSEVFFASMVDRLEQSVFCKDLNGRFTYVNRRFAERLDRSPGDIIGKTDYDLYKKKFAKKYRADDKKVVRSGNTTDVVETNPLPSGETRHVRVIKTPMRDILGRVVGVQGIFWDDTERYLVRTLLDSVPDSIYFKDVDSRFTMINKHLAGQFGLQDPQKAVGKTDHDFFTREHADPARAIEQSIIRTEKPVVELSETETYQDGRVRHVLTTKLPLRDSDGRVIGTFGISRSIEELVHARDQIIRAQELFRDLLSSLKTGNPAHTARTLFAGLHRIFGYTSALLYSYDERKGCLKGAAAYGLDESAVLDRTHVVGYKHSPQKKPRSLAAAVFHRQAAIFVDDVAKPPANQEGRRVLRLKPGTSAIGLPLSADNKFLGVMLVYCADATHRIGPQDMDLLKPYADICALALSIAQAKESSSARARILKTQAAIARRFGRMSANPHITLTSSFGEIVQSARKDLTWIVKHSVRGLGADLGALYLADQPVCVKSNDSNDLDQAYLHGKRLFTLRAMHKYPDKTLDRTTYTPRETALTASVLKKLRPRRSEDVQKEKDWSQKNAAGFKRLFAPSHGLRAWMGVPIVFERASREYLFGALTFTRGRESLNDEMAFTESDEHLAVALAHLFALAFQSLNVAQIELCTMAMKTEVQRQTVEMRSRQEVAAIAVHNLEGPAVGIRYAVENIRDQLGRGTLAKNSKHQMLTSVDNALIQVKAILDTRRNFLNFLGPQLQEQMEHIDLQAHIEQILSQFDSQFFCFSEKPKPRRVLLHPVALQTALTCLLHNANEATENLKCPKITVEVHLTNEKGTVVVTDNGPGVSPTIADRLFELGATTKPLGSGLGLFAARKIMRRVGGNVFHEASHSPGARFVIEFPCRKGDVT